MTTRENLKSRASWTRGLGILLFLLLFSLAEFLLWAIVLFQFASQLISGRPNLRLLDFSRGLNAYIYQILQFVTYRSAVMPYPFANWPDEGLDGEQEPELVEVSPPIEEEEDESRQ